MNIETRPERAILNKQRDDVAAESSKANVKEGKKPVK